MNIFQLDPAMNDMGQTEPYHLTDADKLQLLRALGGDLIQDLQATTPENAKAHFKNLLPLTLNDMVSKKFKLVL